VDSKGERLCRRPIAKCASGFEGETETLNSEASKRKVKIAKKIASMVKVERMKYIQCYGRNYLPNALLIIHNISGSVSPPSHLLPVHSVLSSESSPQFQRFAVLTFAEIESETTDLDMCVFFGPRPPEAERIPMKLADSNLLIKGTCRKNRRCHL